MSKLRFILTCITVLIVVLLSPVGLTGAYADDGTMAAETASQSTETRNNPTGKSTERVAASAETHSMADPSFTVAGTTYTFSAADCDPATGGAQACTNPIQASVDFISGTTAASPWFGSGATPDDGNIYVEAGTYAEDVVINGNAGWNSGANTPVYLGIIGAGSGYTTLDGSYSITNMSGVTLSGFMVRDADVSGNVSSITANHNTGTLKLRDIVVINTSLGADPADHVGDGIRVTDHAGDILLTNVEASNNSDMGAWLDNRAGTGSVSIELSIFNSNGNGGFGIESNRNISLVGVLANDNLHGNSVGNCNATGLTCSGTGNISISSSVFNSNGLPGVIIPHVIGLVATSNGEISLSNVTANSNNDDGVLLINYFDGSTGAIFVELSQFNDNGQGELGDGLQILSRGDVRLLDVTANLNLESGVDLSNGFGEAVADVSVERGQFNDNGLGGLALGSNGDINISGVSVHRNATLGAPSSGANGIDAYSGGNINLSDVTADDNHAGGASLINRAGTGGISVESSTFNSNRHGLQAYSNGNISLIGVTASYNTGGGTSLDNCNYVAGFSCTGTGNIFVSSSAFNNNDVPGAIGATYTGLTATSNGDITLSNMAANYNQYHGAVVFNYFDESTGDIFVELSEFNDNGQGSELGDGLKPQSRGDIHLLDVTASGNLEKGVEADNGYSGGMGNILVELGQFNDNGTEGLELGSFHGDVNLSGASIENNVLLGASLGSPTMATVSCSTFLNHPLGIEAGTPFLALNGVNFSGNAVNYTNTGLVVVNSDCNPASTASGDVHGKGSPLNGSLHANCHAAKGEVDPLCLNSSNIIVRPPSRK